MLLKERFLLLLLIPMWCTFCAWCAVTDMSTLHRPAALSLPYLLCLQVMILQPLPYLLKSQCIVNLQLFVHDQGCGEQHGFWARPPCEYGAVCPSGQQLGGKLLCHEALLQFTCYVFRQYNCSWLLHTVCSAQLVLKS